MLAYTFAMTDVGQSMSTRNWEWEMRSWENRQTSESAQLQLQAGEVVHLAQDVADRIYPKEAPVWIDHMQVQGAHGEWAIQSPITIDILDSLVVFWGLFPGLREWMLLVSLLPWYTRAIVGERSEGGVVAKAMLGARLFLRDP